jgi:hypothetical protein
VGIFLFTGAIILFVAGLLTVDWFMAGRAGGRRMQAVRDAEAGNPSLGYATIQQQSVHDQWKSSP